MRSQSIIEDLIDLLSDKTCAFCGLYRGNNKCFRQSDKWISECIGNYCDNWRPINQSISFISRT